MRSGIIRRSIAALVCAVALVGAAGCGNGGDTAEEAAQAYVDAQNDGDSAKVCELFSAELREQLAAENCPAFIEEQSSGAETSFELIRVEEDGDVATAVVKATAGEGVTPREAELQIGLEREDEEWRVAALGPSGAD